MEVKPGYKQTEVGVIPEEWDVEAARRHRATFATVGKRIAQADYVLTMAVPSSVDASRRWRNRTASTTVDVTDSS